MDNGPFGLLPPPQPTISGHHEDFNRVAFFTNWISRRPSLENCDGASESSIKKM